MPIGKKSFRKVHNIDSKPFSLLPKLQWRTYHVLFPSWNVWFGVFTICYRKKFKIYKIKPFLLKNKRKGIFKCTKKKQKSLNICQLMHINIYIYSKLLKGNVHISIQRVGGGLLTSFLEISLWFFACRPELWSSFWIKNQSGEKLIFPLIFPLSKVINIG